MALDLTDYNYDLFSYPIRKKLSGAKLRKVMIIQSSGLFSICRVLQFIYDELTSVESMGQLDLHKIPVHRKYLALLSTLCCIIPVFDLPLLT